MNTIKMVDLQGQYQKVKGDIDRAIQNVLDTAAFIQGEEVSNFSKALSNYTGSAHTIPCANGTDALQIAMMALDLKPGDEIILPVHTYVATAEVVALLNLVPVFVDVDPRTFNIDVNQIEKSITKRTRAIVPVHLYGQCADMAGIIAIADKNNLFVIEDAAQALGAIYTFPDGQKRQAGSMGIIGTTSFFPSKNLGCYGDGGAIFTQDEKLAKKMKMIANHGQSIKYHHDLIGVNSRLDTLQAAILNVKLKFLDDYTRQRNLVADWYDAMLKDIAFLTTPFRSANSTHVFHQYTLRITARDRDELKKYLETNKIPSMIYYPVPLHLQKAYQNEKFPEGTFPVTETLSKTVISLPIHTELTEEEVSYIANTIRRF